MNSKEENLRRLSQLCPRIRPLYSIGKTFVFVQYCIYVRTTYKHHREWNCSAVSSIVTNKILFLLSFTFRAGIFKKSMGVRHRGGIGFSYRPARLHRLAEFIPWHQFRSPINILKYRLRVPKQEKRTVILSSFRKSWSVFPLPQETRIVV